MVISLVGLLARQLFTTRDVFEVAIICDDFGAAVGVMHIPGFMELADSLFGRMHRGQSRQSS